MTISAGLVEAQTLTALIRTATDRLASAGIETARLDAEILLARAAGAARARLFDGSLRPTAEVRERFAALISRRVRREPIAYILERKEFFSLDFKVTPAVLIPRPETEILVAMALEFVAGRPEATIIDLGTGSGAIAVAIAVNAPWARVVATDVSKDALAVARYNAERLGCAERIDFRRADCWNTLDGGSFEERFTLVVSNPPYVREGDLETLALEIRDFEPRIALGAGRDGLDFYYRIAAGIRAHLETGGQLLVEIGTAWQADAVAAILRNAGSAATDVISDLTGDARIVRANY
jgi:release factor glutamine methyltransferase